MGNLSTATLTREPTASEMREPNRNDLKCAKYISKTFQNSNVSVEQPVSATTTTNNADNTKGRIKTS